MDQGVDRRALDRAGEGLSMGKRPIPTDGIDPATLRAHLHLRGHERSGATLCGYEAARLNTTSDVEVFRRVATGTEPEWAGPRKVCAACDKRAPRRAGAIS